MCITAHLNLRLILLTVHITYNCSKTCIFASSKRKKGNKMKAHKQSLSLTKNIMTRLSTNTKGKKCTVVGTYRGITNHFNDNSSELTEP